MRLSRPDRQRKFHALNQCHYLKGHTPLRVWYVTADLAAESDAITRTCMPRLVPPAHLNLVTAAEPIAVQAKLSICRRAQLTCTANFQARHCRNARAATFRFGFSKLHWPAQKCPHSVRAAPHGLGHTA